jgi:tetratricopeptide (TPR) repeat protein
MNKLTQLTYLICASVLALACMWDRDTIGMETQRFPDALELITGKFLRHSPEFYQWRIKDREAKLKTNPTQWSYYDDLAVAYAKLHNNAKAIELMLKKEKLHPQQYETYANLGTFYIHDKQYEKGLTYIKKAIAINPDAHFGREVYQQYLVEYILSQKKAASDSSTNKRRPNFYFFWTKKVGNSGLSSQPAVKGVLGMMKFGNYRSPVLLEALGDLLVFSGSDPEDNACFLAYFAYQRANKTSRDYTFCLSRHNNQTSKELDEFLAQKIKEGDAFYQQIRQDEMRWIAEGKNPEEEFEKKYYHKETGHFTRLFATLLGIALVVWLVMRRRK